MIYADTSFLFSFYAWDEKSEAAVSTYSGDSRRPLFFTPWQRFELRNTTRTAVQRLRRSRQTVPFLVGNVFRLIDESLNAGRLRHNEPELRKTFRVAEELSAAYSERLGSASVDLWHVASAIVLEADTFWTFDQEQRALAAAVGKFRSVPRL